jgi:hypothetical protein
MIRTRWVGLLPVAALGALFLGPSAPPTQARTGTRAARPRGVEVEMANVDLHMAPGITLRVRNLHGRFVPTGASPANLDANDSYVVEVDAGEVALGEAALNTLMNEHVFVGHDPPVKKLEITLEDGLVKQKGKLDKKIDIPFKTKGVVEATPDGKIRVHAKSIKSLGLPVKGLMKVLGIEMDDMLKIEAGHGVTVDDNDFIIDPSELLPPPKIKGMVTAVRVEGDEIVQTFGGGVAKRIQPAAASKNHIYWRGGDLRFGKLTMRGTDLELIDMDQSDPFDFSVASYNEMLVAGYSKNLPRLGLRTYMPDYDDLKAGRRKGGPGAAPTAAATPSAAAVANVK